jgi:hypothetical protein
VQFEQPAQAKIAFFGAVVIPGPLQITITNCHIHNRADFEAFLETHSVITCSA